MSRRYTARRSLTHCSEPRAESQWEFDKVHTVRWRADGFNGGEVVAVQVVDTSMQTHDVGAVPQMADGGELQVTPNALWGDGGIVVRVFLADNPLIKDEETMRLKAPAAYFEITEPRATSAWGAGSQVLLQWQAKNVPAGTAITIAAYDEASRDTRQIATAAQGITADAGQMMWTVPDISFTSSGWIVQINGAGVESRSEKFQITGSGSTGLCDIRKLKREMYLVRARERHCVSWFCIPFRSTTKWCVKRNRSC